MRRSEAVECDEWLIRPNELEELKNKKYRYKRRKREIEKICCSDIFCLHAPNHMCKKHVHMQACMHSRTYALTHTRALK
jgi:hypothetical protein